MPTLPCAYPRGVSTEPDGFVAVRADNGQLTAANAHDLGALGRASQREEAARRKAIEHLRKEGAVKRATLYPRALTGHLATGVLNLMLAKILTGEVEPRTAKEAAEVAKIVHEIARRESGEEPKDPLRAQERNEQIVNIQNLHMHLQQKADAAKATLPAAETLDVEEVEPVRWEHDAPEVPPEN